MNNSPARSDREHKTPVILSMIRSMGKVLFGDLIPFFTADLYNLKPGTERDALQRLADRMEASARTSLKKGCENDCD